MATLLKVNNSAPNLPSIGIGSGQAPAPTPSIYIGNQAANYTPPPAPSAQHPTWGGAPTVHPTIAQPLPFKFGSGVKNPVFKLPGEFLNSVLNSPAQIGQGITQVAQHNYKAGAGQIGSGLLNAASVLPIGKTFEAGTKGLSLGAKVLTGAKTGLKVGGAYGAAQGATNAMANNEGAKQIALNTLLGGATGALAGGALGGAAPVATAGIKGVAKRVSDIPKNESGFAKLPGENRFQKNAKNAYKVVSGQKDEAAIQAKNTPQLIKFTKEVHDTLVQKRLDKGDKRGADFNQTLGYIRTLSVPDNALKASTKNRANYVRQLADRINKVVIKPQNPDGKAYINTSYLIKDPAKSSRELSAGPSSPASPVGGGDGTISALESKTPLGANYAEKPNSLRPSEIAPRQQASVTPIVPPKGVKVNLSGEQKTSGMPPKLVPSTPKLAPTAKLPPQPPRKGGEPPLAGSSSPNSTPFDHNGQFSSSDYVKQQIQAQKQAAGSELSKGQKIKNELKVKLLDSLAPIEDPVIKQVGRKGELGLRNALDRSLRSPTIAGQFAEQHGLHRIIKSAPNTNEFNQYLLAKHAQDLEANGIKTGRNLQADQHLINDLGPKYEAHAQALRNYNNKLLDETANYGLISHDTAAHLKEKYPNYVPFDRIFKEGELTGGGNGSGPASLSTQTVVQRIKGSERQIQPPLESILAKTHDVIAQGERNLAAKQIVSFKDLPGNPLGLKEIKPSETIGTRSTVSYLDNGVKHTFETTPEVANAAKSLNKQQLGILGKILSYPTRVLRLGATGANAAFAMANVAKDVASAFINSEHPLRASIGNPSVFLNALKAATYHKSGAYHELVSQGAGGTSFDIARNAAKDTISRVRADRNVGTKALYTVRHPGELLRAVEDTIGRSEEFGRAVQYYGNKQAALAKGESSAFARAYGADAARNNTINFARAGEYGRVLNSVLPYLNAGVQGSRTLMRNLKDRPVATGSKIVITAFLPVAATTAWNLNDPARRAAYDDISDYEKQNNIIIIPPNPHKDPKTGRWNVIKIPVSQEIANMNNVVRNGVEALAKDKGFNFAAMAGNLTGTVTSLNAGSPRQLLGQVTPQAIKPGVEALTNQNLFTGNKIIPDSQRNLDPRDQYGTYSSGSAKALGRLLNVSPEMIDNTIRTATGGLGQNVVNLSDRLLAKTGKIPQSDVKGQSLSTSISGRFNSAQGISSGTKVDNAVKQASDKLKQLPGYKSMSNTDKAKALNRLESDVKAAQYQNLDAQNQTGQYAPGYTGKQTKLSTRQAGLLTGSTDVSSYLTTQASKKSSGIPKIPGAKTSTPKVPSANTTTYDDKTKTWTITNKTTGKVTQVSADGTRTVINKGTSTRTAKRTTGGKGTRVARTKSTKGRKIAYKAPKLPKVATFKTPKIHAPKVAYRKPSTRTGKLPVSRLPKIAQKKSPFA